MIQLDDFNAVDIEITLSYSDSIKVSMKNIIMHKYQSIINNDPDYGLNLYSYLGTPLDEITKFTLNKLIKNKLIKNELRIKDIQINLNNDSLNSNGLIIEILYTEILTETTNILVLNYTDK